MLEFGNSVRWVRAWPDDEHPEFRVGRLGSDLVAEWPGFARLRTNRSGSSVDCWIAEQTVPPAVIEKFRKGAVRGLLRHLTGDLTLHGAAVALDERAVVLLGRSGTGKSSTAAALCAGASSLFLADDMAAVTIEDNRITITPMETFHWLTVEAARALEISVPDSDRKQPVLPVRAAGQPVPLAVLVVLEFDEEASGSRVRQLKGQAVFEALTHAAVRFVLDEGPVALHDLNQVWAVATQVPVFELRRSCAIDGLARDVEKIRGLVRSTTPKPGD
jgi:hypothetical protein